MNGASQPPRLRPKLQPSQGARRWYYLYLILNLYSSKIVGWEVHEDDNFTHVHRTALSEGIATLAANPVRHDDNASTLKATTVLSMLHWLGVKPSYSRPRVSDNNAFVERRSVPPSRTGIPGVRLR